MTTSSDERKGLNVPPLRFPEFKGEWEKEELGNSCNVLMCKRIFANQTNKKGGIPFYKIGTIGSIPDCYITPILFSDYQKKYSYPKKGEVLVTCAGTIGRCFQYDGIDSYFQDSNIVWIDNPKKIVDNDFLFYLISAHDWNKLNTTTITRLYNDDIRKIILSFPKSKQEQTKITSLFSAVNKRLSVQRKIIEDHLLLEKALCIFPQNAPQEKLENLCTSLSSTLQESQVEKHGLYPVFGANGVVGYRNDYQSAQPGVAIIKDGAGVGRAFTIIDEKYSILSTLSLLLPKKECPLSFLYYALKKISFRKHIEGSGIPHIYFNDYKNAFVPKPIKEGKIIASLIEINKNNIEVSRKMLFSLESLKEFLLENLFC